MTLSRRALLGSLLASGLPMSKALALSGEPFPVSENEVKEVPFKYRRREVDYKSDEAAGTVVVDPGARFLYLILGGGKAIRYGASVGKAGKSWAGESTIKKMVKWPTWTPTPEHIAAHPDLAKWLPNGMPPGPGNPLGARALYLYQGEVDTVYRIHGSHDVKLIGKKSTAGCFGLLNVDIIHLYDQVTIGTRVVVLNTNSHGLFG